MNLCLLGPLWGDICGVPYEFNPERDPARLDLAHPRQTFSDDSILTLAVAKAIVEGRPYAETIFELAMRYPDAGWGGRFRSLWVVGRDPRPYGSFGNGAAMRVAPVGWAFLEERFGWDLSLTLPEIREQALRDGFDETWKSVPPAIGVFLNTEDFTDCLRQTIALGCDADTQACISCAVAEAYYGPDEALLPRVLAHLDKPLARILESFCGKFGV